MLERATAGIYAAQRVETLPDETLRRHFLRGHGQWDGHFKVRPELSERVAFRRLNFMDAEWDVRAGFDAIFCRNVAIYFDRRTQEALFRRLHALIADHGYIAVGQAESLRFLPELFESLPGAVYRKRARVEGQAEPPGAPLPRSGDAERRPCR